MKSYTLAILMYLLAGFAHAGEPEFFAMDTGTKDQYHQTAEEQVALVKDIGFKGIAPVYTDPEALHEMIVAVDRHKLKLYAVYFGLYLDKPEPISPEIKDAIRQLKGRDTVIWLHVLDSRLKPSDPAGDELAVPVLREVADLAGAADLRVALYPHATVWVETLGDAVRLTKKVDRPNFGVTFNLCHWLMADKRNLDDLLEEASTYLYLATINGADKDGKTWKQLIQPLDSGTFDVIRVQKSLKEIGYKGPVGLQHYGIGGDARANLKRSMKAWKKLQHQLNNMD